MTEKRFQFGANWTDYIARISEGHIEEAKKAFQAFHGLTSLQGKTFLDVGCGSGIHSYVAFQLGAQSVYSFDYDAQSVSATRQLKKLHAPEAKQWTISSGSALDESFLSSLGKFDVVYSWGVLHHTGSMWRAIDLVSRRVAPGGVFHLAIYNRHWTSGAWRSIKRLYCQSPAWVQTVLLGSYAAAEISRIVATKRRNPIRYIREYGKQRGMVWMNDLRDWLGGYPYEYATAGEIEKFMTQRGFSVERRKEAPSLGCSEFLFRLPAV